MFQPDLETMARTDMEALQASRLAGLVEKLRQRKSGYWLAKMAGVGPVRGLGDLPALPFTLKSEFREQYPFGMLAEPMENVVRLHASSGTSGKPTIVAYTRGDVSVFAEVNARALSCAGGTRTTSSTWLMATACSRAASVSTMASRRWGPWPYLPPVGTHRSRWHY